MFEIVLEASEGVRQALGQPLELRLVGVLILRREFRVLHRNDVLRGADEHRQVTDLVGDCLNHLDSGRTDTDDTDALAGEIDRFIRPARGVEQSPLERLLSGEQRRHRGGQHSAAGDQILRVDYLALVSGDRPTSGRLVEMRALDRRVELDVTAQVELVSDVVHPALNLRLRRELLAPAPSLVEIL